MNDFDKNLIEQLQNTELNTLNYVSTERKNLLRLRTNLLTVLYNYDDEVKEYFYKDRLSIIKQILGELSVTLDYLKGIAEYNNLDINHIDMLIEVCDSVYELEILINRIQEDKKINLSSRVSNFLSKPHCLILRLEMLNAEIESVYLSEDDDDYLDINEEE